MPNQTKRKSKLNRAFLALSLIAIILLAACRPAAPEATATAAPTLTPEPILPTRTPVQEPTAIMAATPSRTPTRVPQPTRTMQAAPVEDPSPDTAQNSQEELYASELERFGITGGIGHAAAALQAGLPFSALLNWNVAVDVPQADFEFWQMVRIEEAGIRRTTWEEITLAIQANPGSYWMVGNEPDVRWQDNVTPQRYAEIYHEVYSFIKERDPEAKVVIGGVTQPTPLRRAYLDIVLDTYEETYGQEMPVDVWNVHAFTLREERDSWGVDIPPGMDDELAILYEIEDHDNLEILEQNLTDFRAWMLERGYGDKPLIISEYGILMPEDYGFPHERVAEFLTGSFTLFENLTGAAGYQPDDGRLVQRWFWYSVYDGEVYPTGNLFSPSGGELTLLGETWAEYVSGSAMDSGLKP